MARLAETLKAAGIEGSLVERAERAVSAAERAKIEANAKLISDSIEHFVNFFLASGKALMPEGGVSAAQDAYLEVKEAREVAQVDQRCRGGVWNGVWQRLREDLVDPLLVWERHLYGDW